MITWLLELPWPAWIALWFILGLVIAFVYKFLFVRDSLWEPVEGYMFAALLGPFLLLLIAADFLIGYFNIDL